jgi:hypothetical protein
MNIQFKSLFALTTLLALANLQAINITQTITNLATPWNDDATRKIGDVSFNDQLDVVTLGLLVVSMGYKSMLGSPFYYRSYRSHTFIQETLPTWLAYHEIFKTGTTIFQKNRNTLSFLLTAMKLLAIIGIDLAPARTAAYNRELGLRTW